MNTYLKKINLHKRNYIHYFWNNFEIKTMTNDVSFYDKKLWMVYVSGWELEIKNTNGQRLISLSEGVPH